MRKRVAILGSTGSIGTQALDVIAHHRDEFEVVALAAGRNVELLREQAIRFNVTIVTTAQDGNAGLLRVAVESEPDIVLAATDGAVAFEAVFAAVERGIDVAIANKEVIVSAGNLLVELARSSGSQLIPVDSEHSAIFQCLAGEITSSVAAIVLTASGGPFWRVSREAMENADVSSALAHPTWRMGAKNTIDSATMMNKGLEVIEASRLFGLPGERIQIVVHPQSVTHGFVVFTDGSVKSQLGAPDMRVPIGYALSYPKRLRSLPQQRFAQASDVIQLLGGTQGEHALRYDFEPSDTERFPCVRLAYEALAAGGSLPAVLSAANEIAVSAFIEGRIAFGRIAHVIEAVMTSVPPDEPTLRGIRLADGRARQIAGEVVSSIEEVSRS